MKKNDNLSELKSVKKTDVGTAYQQELTKKKIFNIKKSGMLGSLSLIILTCAISGHLVVFFHTTSILIPIVIPLCLLTTTYGLKGLQIVFLAPFNLIIYGDTRQLYRNVFIDLKTYVIFSGWIATGIGLLLVLRVEEFMATEQGYFGLTNNIGLAFLTTIYGYIVAYCFCHPIIRKIETNKRDKEE